MPKILFIISILFASSIIVLSQSKNTSAKNYELYDSTRSRHIPVKIYFNTETCGKSIVIFNHGYGLKSDDYSFITNHLILLGYTVVCVQHDLAKDKPLPRNGNIFDLRLPVWIRGVENINFVLASLKQKHDTWNYKNLVVIGHSNGGDIALLYSQKYGQNIHKVITLDNLRMPIPRVVTPKFLSLRANDTKADAGVIPSIEEQAEYKIKITSLQGSHNLMCDHGDEELKNRIIEEIEVFLTPNTN